MANSTFVQAIATIQSKLQPFLALSISNPLHHTPVFDAHATYSPLRPRLDEIASQVAALGLPEETATAIISVLSEENSKYHEFVESSRRQLLDELSRSAASTNPSELPRLVEAACSAFLNSSIDNSLDKMRNYFGGFASQQESGSEQGDSADSTEASESEGGDEDEDPDGNLEAEEDDNAPMKPGEEVPPLDTKFLPIFEALHERGKVLTKPEKTYLVNMTGMTYRQITIWFQNRRRGELKEDATMRASSLREGSVHSLNSSDASEDEADLEKHLNSATDTTFNIRSWQLTSALATKDGHGGSLPPSPSKFTFGAQIAIPSYDIDDTDLSDSDDEVDGPPGLRVPSLTDSVATLNSATTRSANLSQLSGFMEPVIVSETPPGAAVSSFPRPVKALPLSRRSPPAASSQPAQPQAPTLDFNFTGSALAPAHKQFPNVLASAPAPPSQFVTSNERGLAVEMTGTSVLSVSTLRSPSPTGPPPPRFTTPPAHASASSPSNSGSRQNSSSPSPHSSSPRPAAKPLPRRTGCAPRPRPPPRATTASAAAPTLSARPSIILPPSSNPSLAATTLGSLLRPSVAPPAIPAEMQERLSAMAGRMGVSSGSGTVGRSGSIGVQSPSHSAFPHRSFSFGLASVPQAGATNPTPAPGSEQPTPATTNASPISS